MTLPVLAVGIMDIYGVRYVRLGHVIDWLQDKEDAIEADPLADPVVAASRISEIQVIRESLVEAAFPEANQ